MPGDRSGGDFGAKLREARERRGISIRQISNATKISVAVLEALERNDISRLPGGIFGRAFVRSYAAEVGLDPEATLQDFIARFPNETVTAGHSTAKLSEERDLFESERRTAGTFLSLLAISVPVAAVVLYFGMGSRRAAREAASPPPTAVEAPVPAPPPPVAPPVDVPRAPAEAPPASAAAPPPVARDAPVRTVGDADERLTIGLAVRRPCWVSATVDGRKAIERLLQAGERETIEVRREMVLTAGDAAAIALTLNGADARPLGKAGEVVTARLDLSNFKGFLQTR
jgi:cytoskeletal protein RodZ